MRVTEVGAVPPCPARSSHGCHLLEKVRQVLACLHRVRRGGNGSVLQSAWPQQLLLYFSHIPCHEMRAKLPADISVRSGLCHCQQEGFRGSAGSWNGAVGPCCYCHLLLYQSNARRRYLSLTQMEPRSQHCSRAPGMQFNPVQLWGQRAAAEGCSAASKAEQLAAGAWSELESPFLRPPGHEGRVKAKGWQRENNACQRKVRCNCRAHSTIPF